ncbi:MAG: hypothetical protein HRU75_05595 [Planctomycetia bacterium]|nr:MAG: hypothetical protein HRU75_05595 [Planctomycetia bacterium]
MKYTQFASLLVLPCLLALSSCDKKQPAEQSKAGTPQQTAAAEPDWCAEHGVPESICTRCNKKLIAEFKKKGDWCKEHDLPESQCILCNPELKEKFEAMKPKEGK